MRSVPLPPYGKGFIFRDGKTGGRLGWGSGRGLLGYYTMSTTDKEVEGVRSIP